jgi:hypothetical protein
VWESADALVAGPFGLLGAAAAVQQIWQSVHDRETSTVWGSVAVIAVVVCPENRVRLLDASSVRDAVRKPITALPEPDHCHRVCHPKV